MALILSAVAFVLITGLVILFGYRRYVVAGRVYENLASVAEPGTGIFKGANPHFFSVRNLAQAVARRLPASAQTASALRIRLMAAGYRDESAVAVLYGAKLMLTALTGTFFAVLEMNSTASVPFRLVSVAVAILAGFRVPDYFVGRRVNQRRKRLRQALPDALDLIIVCVEAGLTIDRAMRSVTQMLAIAHRELADEMNLVTAEITAGLRRREALENFAIRTQEPEIKKFVAVVAQADRFGTSLAVALRTHADYLRVRRRQIAEEKASKVSVKMIFPIFFFIMPCMMLVTVGPAAIAIMKHLVPAMTGGMH